MVKERAQKMKSTHSHRIWNLPDSILVTDYKMRISKPTTFDELLLLSHFKYTEGGAFPKSKNPQTIEDIGFPLFALKKKRALK